MNKKMPPISLEDGRHFVLRGDARYFTITMRVFPSLVRMMVTPF